MWKLDDMEIHMIDDSLKTDIRTSIATIGLSEIHWISISCITAYNGSQSFHFWFHDKFRKYSSLNIQLDFPFNY